MEAVQAAATRLNMRSDHPYLLTASYEGASAYKAAGKHAKAIELFEKCLPLAEQQKVGAYGVWLIQHNLGWSYLSESRRDEAIAIFEKNLKIAQPQHDLSSIEALGWALRAVDLDRSISLYEQARELRHERNGPDDPEALRVARSQAMVLRQAGKSAAAIALLDQIIPQWERVQGRDHYQVAKAHLERANSLADMKDLEAADAAFQDAIARLEKSKGLKDPESLEGRRQRLLAVQASGQHLRAAEMAGDLARRWRDADSSRPVRLADVLLAQGSCFVKAGRPADGESALRESVAIYSQKAPQGWNLANAKYWLGTALLDQKKFGEADSLLNAAFAEMTERIDLMPPWGKNHRRDVAARLVALYEAQGKSLEAAQWHKELDALSAAASRSPE